MFLEKRVYQGSSGVVYPYPVIDKVYDEKYDKEYTALFLENEFIKVMILPEIGGRIQMAYDKTNDYHFVYYNHVIKPALVGLTGPWVSGGIEFNWPQHHRPSTFQPTDYAIKENEDGSCTVWVNEYEIMFGTKCAAGFTLYPDKAYIEIHAKLYNRTPFPQTFLWWANPAVSVDEHYQSVFPPDVNAVFDHGKRDVISFPIANGTYYKVNYSDSDISIYNNIPVPTSYMAVDSDFDFVGGYHHKKRAGIMHVANHHISPGKKQWTWGSGEFGRAWDKQLTDNDGPYFELMCGVYTDNQPDFGWIMPDEVREFKQYFMPYKNIGYVKNASIDAMINLELDDSGRANGKSHEKSAKLQVYLTGKQEVTIRLKAKESVLFTETVFLSPTQTFEKSINLPNDFLPSELYAEVVDKQGRVLISYTPVSREGEGIPDPAKAIAPASVIKTTEELYLAGLHLEQYRHATYSPLDYYQEALKRDPSDLRCNNAMGLWYLRRGEFLLAEPFLKKAVEKLTVHNPNPYDGEPLYNLGLCLKYQKRYDEAFRHLFKSTWNAAYQDVGFLQLACISAIKNNWNECFELAEKSILKNYRSSRARLLKAISLRKMNRTNEAIRTLEESVSFDPFDFAAKFEMHLSLIQQGQNDTAEKLKAELKKLMRARSYSFTEIALQYADAGCFAEAAELLSFISSDTKDPMVFYYLAFFESNIGNEKAVNRWLAKAFEQSPDRVFPNRIEDISVLLNAATYNPTDFKAWYYLGNFYYGKRMYEKARDCWEQSQRIEPAFATSARNLGLAFYNKFDKKEKARQLFEQAFNNDKTDSRVLFELDQLYKKLNHDPAKRLDFLRKFPELVTERDDLYTEFITLHSLTGDYKTAKKLLLSRSFHPWEGGEGKTSGQHVLINTELARQALHEERLSDAEALLKEALVYPPNISEGKLYGAQENDVYYWLGCVKEKSGDMETAAHNWQKAARGLSEPLQAVFYNDQQPDKIFYQGLALLKLGMEKEAHQRFENLIAYGQKHLNDTVKMDYFAVSLPDLLIFDDDLSLRNHIHCLYLLGLGNMGLKNIVDSEAFFEKVLTLDKAHQGAAVHKSMIDIESKSIAGAK